MIAAGRFGATKAYVKKRNDNTSQHIVCKPNYTVLDIVFRMARTPNFPQNSNRFALFYDFLRKPLFFAGQVSRPQKPRTESGPPSGFFPKKVHPGNFVIPLIISGNNNARSGGQDPDVAPICGRTRAL
jgi:hypothetical protein